MNGNEASADIVITSFDTSLTYQKLDDACRLIREGAEYLSTHPDFNCPTETGFMPDSGAIAALVTASTGKVPTYFGKPYRETIEMICEATGMQPAEMCIFGDRLYTDIAVGKRHGVTAVLVLSGESTLEDVEKAEEIESCAGVVSTIKDAFLRELYTQSLTRKLCTLLLPYVDRKVAREVLLSFANKSPDSPE